MAVPRNLKRLVALRRAEEQHRRTSMEMAIAELRRLEDALNEALVRSKRGRMGIVAAIASGECEDRVAGMAEIAAAERVAALLTQRIHFAEQKVGELRDAFLAKMVQRRQAESLLENHTTRERLEISRRSQLALDEWHRSRNSGRSTGRSANQSNREPDGLSLSPDG